MQRQRHLVLADRLDRRVEFDRGAGDGVTFGRNQGSDIAGRDRAEQLAGFARLADDDEGLAVDLGRDLAGFALALEALLLQLRLHAFVFGLAFGIGAQRLAAGQQKVAGIAVLDADNVAHLAEFADAFEQNDFHGSSPLWIV